MMKTATENRRPERIARAIRALIPLLTVVTALLGVTVPAQEAHRSGTQPLSSIQAAARSYIQSLLPAAADSTVSPGALDQRLRLARCATALQASLPAGMSVQARMTVGVSCTGPVRWTVYVPVVVETRVAVLVLRHAVARDARLTAEDVSVETRKVSGPGAAYLSAVNELQDRSARRPLAVGTELTVDMFAADMIVHRGQEVTLLASAGAIEVRAAGRALADAAAGARVAVQNLNSLQVVEGVVESADVVRVAL